MSDEYDEEREILDALERDALRPTEHAHEIRERHQRYAEAMFRKDARINIRLPSKDLRALQKKALAEGVPYQTLIASVLHKYAEDRLQEKPG